MAEKKEINRITEGLLDWTRKEGRLREVFGNGVVNGRDYVGAKRDFFRDLYKTCGTNPSAEEKVMMAIVGGEIRKLDNRLYPNAAVRLIAKVGEVIKEWLQTSRQNMSGGREMTVIHSGKEGGYKKNPDKRTNLGESQSLRTGGYRKDPVELKRKKKEVIVSTKKEDALLPKKRRNPNNSYGVH